MSVMIIKSVGVSDLSEGSLGTRLMIKAIALIAKTWPTQILVDALQKWICKLTSLEWCHLLCGQLQAYSPKQGLKIKLKAKIINCRWTDFFWRAVSVCFPAKCHQYHDHVAVIPTILTLLKSYLVQATKIRLVWLKANFINSYSSLVPKLSFHAWSIKLDSGKACMWTTILCNT